MILLDIKNHLMEVQKTSLFALASQFKLTVPVLEGMMRCLLQKGCVRKILSDCGTKCNQCSTDMDIAYEWVKGEESVILPL